MDIVRTVTLTEGKRGWHTGRRHGVARTA